MVGKSLFYGLLLVVGMAIGHGSTQAHRPLFPTTEAQPEAPAPIAKYARGKESSVHLVFQTAGCTGTVYGRSKHVILTAMHCIHQGGPLALVDGKPVTAQVMSTDGHDHIFLRVDQPMSKPGATIGPMPAPGSEVYIWGNPADMESQLRIGHVAGRWSYGGTIFDTIDINSWHGDSGGAFFDQTGHIVAITYGHDEDNDEGGSWKMGIVEPFAFTPAQLREAEGG